MRETGDTAPGVSVVMPLYNAAPYVLAAVRSVLDQDHRDLELVVVDDGSTDGSADVLASIQDPRLKVVAQENQGVAAALITAMRIARAPLIARLDADDQAVPGRLQRQVEYLAAHPEIGLLGTAAIVTHPDGRPKGELRHPEEDASIRYALHFDTPFVHPSVMFRRSAYEAAGGYRTDAAVFEDYDLWWRLARCTRMANLHDALVHYRETPLSASRSAQRDARTQEQRKRIALETQPDLTDREAHLIAGSGFRHDRVTLGEFRRIKAHLSAIMKASHAEGALRERMLADARGRLRGYHLNARSNLFSKALDRVLVELALRLPTPPLS